MLALDIAKVVLVPSAVWNVLFASLLKAGEVQRQPAFLERGAFLADTQITVLWLGWHCGGNLTAGSSLPGCKAPLALAAFGVVEGPDDHCTSEKQGHRVGRDLGVVGRHSFNDCDLSNGLGKDALRSSTDGL